MSDISSPAPGTVTDRLAAFIHESALDRVPTEVVHETKRILLDCLGSMVAGVTTGLGAIARDHAAAFLTSGQGASVVGRPDPVEASYAAFANTVLCNALDYEPVGPEGHVCAVAVPSALAVAERTGASGTALLEALIVALEVGGRVGSALRRPSSRMASGIPPVRGTPHAVFGAAAAAIRLLGLDRETSRHALGIAGYSATLPTLRKAMEAVVMPMTKYDHLAKVAQSGVEAAVLAERGFTGDLAIFEGDIGFWRFSGALGCDWETLTEGYGSEWLIPQTWYKPYPCILYVTPGIQATLAAMDESGLGPEALDSVAILTSHLQAGQLIDGISDPLAPWMNYRWNVAAELHRIRPRRLWHQPQSAPAAVQETMRKISVQKLPPEEGARHGYWEGWAPAEAEIRVDGRTYRNAVQYLPKLDDEALTVKFRDNVSGLLSSQDADRMVDAVWQLERLDSVFELTALLSHVNR